MIKIVDATPESSPLIRAIADKTWWQTYSPILSEAQIEYMLNAIYSTSALQKVMENGSQRFIILYEGNQAKAFASYGNRNEDPTVCKIHKIYVVPESHGKGYGRMLVEEIKSRLVTQKIYALDLNVNRYNPAKSFYEKLGFTIVREEDVAIGPYWMNDYVMRLTINAQDN